MGSAPSIPFLVLVRLGELARREQPHLVGDDLRQTTSLCMDAVRFALTGVGQHVGTSARAGALLLLELGVPHLPLEVRRDLAAACEREALELAETLGS